MRGFARNPRLTHQSTRGLEWPLATRFSLSDHQQSRTCLRQVNAATAASMTATTLSSSHRPDDHPNPPSVPPLEKMGS
jgi:hypothetical protein